MHKAFIIKQLYSVSEAHSVQVLAKSQQVVIPDNASLTHMLNHIHQYKSS